MRWGLILCTGVATALFTSSCGSSSEGNSSGAPSDGGAAGAGAAGGAAGGPGGGGQFAVPRLTDCLASCDATYPEGRTSLGSLANQCACQSCAAACGPLCSAGTLDDGCAHGCLIPMLDMGACDNEKYECNHDATCQPYFQCVSRCITPQGMSGLPLPQMRQACVDRINDYRAMEGVPPLSRNQGAESCTDAASAKDEQLKQPHASFGSCGEHGQNECFDLATGYESMIFLRCLEEMFMEKFTGVENGGHYKNMVDPSFGSVACGFGVAASTQNFF